MSTVQSTSPTRKWGRKNLLIFPQFQLAIIGFNAFVLLIFGLFLWVAVERAVGDLEPAAGLAASESSFFKDYLAHQLTQVRWSLLIAGFFGLLTSVLVTLAVSHRFAGPLLRLKGYFARVAESPDPIPELTFRDGDFLSDLPPLVNKALHAVKNANERKS